MGTRPGTILGISEIDEVEVPGPGPFLFSAFLKPCVLPPWLEASRIPSAAGAISSKKANVKSKTLSGILVRADRDKEN
ncbi:hypothetical protein PR202_ga05412 [Eleusine coracana subsp. coracana]|uniref:Uncharacterized protein n=1 Tax=Eleusine coracana subsp. coracana TaxID=191504 RepID=A0AAV5BTK3_ELECO|nr:hypothetical protein PR202_ga04959 [Eleusine coracana subsp. coracana]GJM89243.1 hypothetical protein PR202_ga05412 [Eleusine coracana subsp. coracana]